MPHLSLGPFEGPRYSTRSPAPARQSGPVQYSATQNPLNAKFPQTPTTLFDPSEELDSSESARLRMYTGDACRGPAAPAVVVGAPMSAMLS